MGQFLSFADFTYDLRRQGLSLAYFQDFRSVVLEVYHDYLPSPPPFYFFIIFIIIILKLLALNAQLSLYHGGEILGEPMFSQQVTPGCTLRFHSGIVFPIKLSDMPRSTRLVAKVCDN
jgi:hypothetical protein